MRTLWGMRFSVALERPEEALMTSRAFSAETPCFTKATSPSPAAQRFTARRALLMAFTACPAPTGPTWTTFLA